MKQIYVPEIPQIDNKIVRTLSPMAPIKSSHLADTHSVPSVNSFYEISSNKGNTNVTSENMMDQNIDLVSQLDTLEALARKQIQQRKEVVSKKIVEEITDNDVNSFPALDLDALDALEKLARDKISKKKQTDSCKYEENVLDESINVMNLQRFIAVHVVTQINNVTGKTEKLIRCIKTGKIYVTLVFIISHYLS